jgi:hypothetical protein
MAHIHVTAPVQVVGANGIRLTWRQFGTEKMSWHRQAALLP